MLTRSMLIFIVAAALAAPSYAAPLSQEEGVDVLANNGKGKGRGNGKGNGGGNGGGKGWGSCK